jgi:hypothetical protein
VKINDAELQAEKKRLTHRLELATARARRRPPLFRDVHVVIDAVADRQAGTTVGEQS